MISEVKGGIKMKSSFFKGTLCSLVAVALLGGGVYNYTKEHNMQIVKYESAINANIELEEPGWAIPSLETLRELRENGKDDVGYTEFRFKTHPFDIMPEDTVDFYHTSLSRVNSELFEPNPSLYLNDEVYYYTYLIKVNDSPAYIDGWDPKVLRSNFDPAGGILMSFGLQDTIFDKEKTGQKIDVIFNFHRFDHEIIKQMKLSIPSYMPTLNFNGAASWAYDTNPNIEKPLFVFWSAKYMEPSNKSNGK